MTWLVLRAAPKADLSAPLQRAVNALGRHQRPVEHWVDGETHALRVVGGPISAIASRARAHDWRVVGRGRLNRSDGGGTLPSATLRTIATTLAQNPDAAAWPDGEFACACWLPHDDGLLVIRDAAGIEDVATRVGPDWIAASDDIAALAALEPDQLNTDDDAVADVLATGFLLHDAASIWREVRRVPQGHQRRLQIGGRVTDRAWFSIPDPSAWRWRSERALRADLHEALGRAVRRRVPEGGGTVVGLSGGIDSTLIAQEARAERAQAVTIVYDRLAKEAEGELAAATARGLGMPHRRVVAEPYMLREPSAELLAPEPWVAPALLAESALMDLAADSDGVLLQGYGGDAVLGAAANRVEDFRRHHAAWLLPFGVLSGLLRGQRPGLWSAIASAPDATAPSAVFSDRWLRSVGAVDRERRLRSALGAGDHIRSLWTSPLWRMVFLAHAPAFHGRAMVARHPYFDRELAAVCDAIPSAPWRLGKALARTLLLPQVPDTVRRRTKTVLPGDLQRRICTARSGQGWREAGHATAVSLGLADDARLTHVMEGGPAGARDLMAAERLLLFGWWSSAPRDAPQPVRATVWAPEGVELQ